jgi:hypothetical protein
VTIRAIAGLVALNVAFAVMGLTFLWGLRGFRRWADVLRLAGLGYVLGLAAFGVVWTELLVVGVTFGGWGIVLTLVLGCAIGCGVAVGLRRPWPEAVSVSNAPSISPAALLVTAAGVALVGLLLEALFRAARLQSLQAFDAWAFWVPKAKAIYFFGGLDEQVFTTTPGPTYPPLVPILDAAAFHAMGGVDTITFHLQYWLVVVGAVAAIAGCLYRRVPAWFFWPPLVLVLVVPRFGERLLTPQGDVLVDVFFVLGALLLALWLLDWHGWRLAGAAVLLAAATLTKREGLFFAAAAITVAVAASWSRRRAAWPRLGAVAAVVIAAAIPWRLWYRSRDITGEAPPDLGASAAFDRAVDSLRLSLDALFDNALWSIVPVVLFLLIGATFAWGNRRLATFFGGLTVLLVLGGAWVTYSYATLPITQNEALNPIVRYTGSIILLGAAAIPLLLASMWRGRGSDEP